MSRRRFPGRIHFLLFLLFVSTATGKAVPQSRNFVVVEPGELVEAIVCKAAHVVPARRQLAWQEREFIAFVHFGLNTFTGKEWGEGNESPALFNPVSFDAREWARVFKEAGMKQVILTAKHHDGFCLWPTAETDYSVKASPWREGKGDIVREVAEACREYGLKWGIYLSPWDRHEKTYGDSPRYNEFFRRQLRELLSGYGEVSEVWLDGACGEGPDGRHQVYDWASFYAVIRELQPEAVISGMGPDVRWVGTESGCARETEWSVVPLPASLLDVGRVRPGPYPADDAFSPKNFTEPDVGGREKLRGAAALLWYPAEADVSIRPGWFYHPCEDSRVKTAETLVDIYFNSVGRNSVLLLNVPADRRGLLPERDIESLLRMREILNGIFRENLTTGASVRASSEKEGYPAGAVLDERKETFWTTRDGIGRATIEFTLRRETTFDVALLGEHIGVGQRVESFRLEARAGGRWKEFARGTTIGYRRLLRFPPVKAKAVRLVVESSRANPTLSAFGLFFSSGRSR